MKILDGKQLATEIKKEIANEVDRIKATGGNVPHLAAVLVGDEQGQFML
jgi:methylenetetrahydrofolate dehydrogenase (NADP+)/methenyltetrahydrofolate cyclohydrolase